MRVIAVLVALTAAGCGDSPNAPDALTGTWGGEHVRLTVVSGGGQLEFDCARGAMTEALVPQSDGSFNVAGYYVAEQGGPVRDDGREVRRPTTYSGRVSGSTLTLRFVVEGDMVYGPYTLERDRAAVIRKCL